MAPRGTWTVAINVLLLALSSTGTSKPLDCRKPYVLEHTNLKAKPFQPDTSDKYWCPSPYKLFGDTCFKTIQPGGYKDIVDLDFSTASKSCGKEGANATMVNDLTDTDVQQATLSVLQQFEGFRELLMFEENTCVKRSGSQAWGEQFCVVPCQRRKNKVYICKCPALANET
ncbi:uncharacterized protein [Branchiostoma lanceolatum]|uniref:uncharacterized protein n=1 Tax=Branchiostoma lanceolatum TaxID=7740 RepID=UPI0034560244